MAVEYAVILGRFIVVCIATKSVMESNANNNSTHFGNTVRTASSS
jgi:hypothetical protein